MYDFTSRKFLSFSLEKQHKKCAELVHHLYELALQNKWDPNKLIIYNELQSWMSESPLTSPSYQELSDRYHYHLKLACIQKKEHHLLSSIRSQDRVQKDPIWPISIYLDHLRSAHNVGSIIRTVEAFSLGALYFSTQTPYVDHKQVRDASMGAYQWVTCHPNADIMKLTSPIIALETSEKAIDIYEFIFPESFTLVLGNEEYGCSQQTLLKADYLIEIPLRGKKNSLNVANAFAIAAGEIYRQRKNRLSPVLT
jgi:tRNA G18 (ribose-2'-O)-methylase SpoU